MSRDKIVSLVEKNALGEEDELCSGNGFWFQVRDNEMIDKHLIGAALQDFNRISESVSVLTSPPSDAQIKSSSEKVSKVLENTVVTNLKGMKFDVVAEGPENTSQDAPVESKKVESDADGMVRLPSEKDLEYPDLPGSEVPAKSEMVLPKSEDLEFPDLLGGASGKIPTEIPQSSLSQSELPASISAISSEESEVPSRHSGAIEIDFQNMESSAGPSGQSPDSGIIGPEDDHAKRAERIREKISKSQKAFNTQEIRIRNIGREVTARKKRPASGTGSKGIRKKERSDGYLNVLFFLFISALLAIAYYYISVIKRPFPEVSMIKEVVKSSKRSAYADRVLDG
ncbi:MAG: hypothetical protein A2385_08065 [Bdellovibrionales bacterium RIFOXYB1_FULL_39_21]|nr:MAG: hypothetical protein A2385_08065 [Bdellovibrionales bacterium RIFOXYB1_FULL_39_21]OFZ42987.1 MAG: hypothetical protein A2485_11160 [Bdellovibrionales bacterium RIFOXYC12_FULL_39_17]OFZ50927.1 MAG: hypothetical protein A2404_06980 [Bdellovibrionales bacterium RIFOXYC1_FULL_39_130]OFZ78150.1 MAG: hypothetical protein A2560_02150 [Bdellovibrionales bacterium RIFOXYD1_FULL_39_84]